MYFKSLSTFFPVGFFFLLIKTSEVSFESHLVCPLKSPPPYFPLFFFPPPLPFSLFLSHLSRNSEFHLCSFRGIFLLYLVFSFPFHPCPYLLFFLPSLRLISLSLLLFLPPPHPFPCKLLIFWAPLLCFLLLLLEGLGGDLCFLSALVGAIRLFDIIW